MTAPTGPTGPTAALDLGGLTVYQRMLGVLAEMPAIGKTQQNREQGFMFRGHDDVMNALNPLLAKWGIFVVPNVLERIPATRQTSRGSTMYEVNLHVEFTFYGAGGDSFKASGWGEGTDMGDKSTNKAMTAAFKYVLAQSFALATAELSDSDAGTPEETTRQQDIPRPKPKPKPKPKGDTPATWDEIQNLLENYSDEGATWALFQRFGASARKLLFPDIDELDADQKVVLFDAAATAAVALWKEVDSAKFPPPTEEDLAKAWASALDGRVLEPTPVA